MRTVISRINETLATVALHFATLKIGQFLTISSKWTHYTYCVESLNTMALLR